MSLFTLNFFYAPRRRGPHHVVCLRAPTILDPPLFIYMHLIEHLSNRDSYSFVENTHIIIRITFCATSFLLAHLHTSPPPTNIVIKLIIIDIIINYHLYRARYLKHYEALGDVINSYLFASCFLFSL